MKTKRQRNKDRGKLRQAETNVQKKKKDEKKS